MATPLVAPPVATFCKLLVKELKDRTRLDSISGNKVMSRSAPFQERLRYWKISRQAEFRRRGSYSLLEHALAIWQDIARPNSI